MARIISSVVGDTFVSLTVGKTTVTVDFSELSKEMIAKLALHGLKQKLADSAASSLTDAERIEKISGTADNLRAGVWNSTGGGTTSLLVEAIARVKKCTIEQAQMAVDGLDDEKEKAVKNNAQIKLAIAQIKTERAEARAKVSVEDTSLDDLLN
jgi:hypothetical protein